MMDVLSLVVHGENEVEVRERVARKIMSFAENPGEWTYVIRARWDHWANDYVVDVTATRETT